MAKVHITLSIDKDVYDAAKIADLNLSAEFQEWINIRMNQYKSDSEEANINADLEIAKHMAEIKKLQNIAEKQKDEESLRNEEVMVVDDMIDNIVKVEMHMDCNKGRSLEDLAREPIKARGLVFLFQKRFNRALNAEDALNMLLIRIKERGL